MANIRISSRIDKIQRELQQVLTHATHYSGIDKKDAVIIERDAMAIAEMGAMLVDLCNGRKPSKTTKAVRKALGYTYP